MKVNLEEIRMMLTVKGIDLTEDELKNLVNYYTKRIVSYTGIDLDVQTYHYTIVNKHRIKNIVLPLLNIFDVDQIHIDYELYDDSKYFVDNKNGVIHFKEMLPYCEHIHIKYLTKADETLINNILTPLIADMIIDGQTNSESNIDGEVTSIHEGNTSISFKNSTSIKDSIQNRLDKLANGQLNNNVRKGAYYI